MQSISHALVVTSHSKATNPSTHAPDLQHCATGKAPASRTDAGAKPPAARGWSGDLTLLKQVSEPPSSPPKSSTFVLNTKALKLKRCKHATLTGGRLHMQERPDWAGTFVGITYRPGASWTALHITQFLKHYRAWCDKREIECRYIWVAEMQKRGAIHYHLILFHPKRFSIPFPDRKGWWPHGSSSISKGIRNAVHYMAKYLSKGDFKMFPKNARTYGSGGLDGTAKIEMRYWKLPGWVRELNPIENASDGFKRVLGGFYSPSTGEMLICPWQVSFVGGCIIVRRKPEAG